MMMQKRVSFSALPIRENIPTTQSISTTAVNQGIRAEFDFLFHIGIV